MIGELTPRQIEQFLHEQVIGRIGCHVEGRTYVVPITYVVAHREGLKVQMMRENPAVCFEVEDLRHLPEWKSAIVYGRYTRSGRRKCAREPAGALARRTTESSMHAFGRSGVFARRHTKNAPKLCSGSSSRRRPADTKHESLEGCVGYVNCSAHGA